MRPLGQCLEYLIPARRDADPKYEMILVCRSILIDRELEEGAAGGLARHKIGHMGEQILCIGESELDTMGVDPARRSDLAVKELVELHHAEGLSCDGQPTEGLSNPRVHRVPQSGLEYSIRG